MEYPGRELQLLLTHVMALVYVQSDSIKMRNIVFYISLNLRHKRVFKHIWVSSLV
jgi:hypothetical protein